MCSSDLKLLLLLIIAFASAVAISTYMVAITFACFSVCYRCCLRLKSLSYSSLHNYSSHKSIEYCSNCEAKSKRGTSVEGSSDGKQENKQT